MRSGGSRGVEGWVVQAEGKQVAGMETSTQTTPPDKQIICKKFPICKIHGHMGKAALLHLTWPWGNHHQHNHYK